MKKIILTAIAALTLGLQAQAQSELYPQHFDLEEVTLLDGPFKAAMDLNIKHLMSYDVDRLLTARSVCSWRKEGGEIKISRRF